MDGFKSIFTSKTFIGILVSIIAKSLVMFGFEVGESIEQELTTLILTVIGFSGDAFAIYGRVKATKKIN
jgi:hypothetical protein